MIKFTLLITLEPKPGKEKEAADFLRSSLPLVEERPGTICWYSVNTGVNKFKIFETVPIEEGHKAELSGKVAQALMEKAPGLFSKGPHIEQVYWH